MEIEENIMAIPEAVAEINPVVTQNITGSQKRNLRLIALIFTVDQSHEDKENIIRQLFCDPTRFSEWVSFDIKTARVIDISVEIKGGSGPRECIFQVGILYKGEAKFHKNNLKNMVMKSVPINTIYVDRMCNTSKVDVLHWAEFFKGAIDKANEAIKKYAK